VSASDGIRGASVRLFAAADEPAVASLWRQVFVDDRPWGAPAAIIGRKIAERDRMFWVAQLDGRVVGAVMAGYDGQRGWIYHLAVEPDLRRRGIGRALVRAAEETLVRRGCPKVNLQVMPANRDVVEFYERLGYAVEERVSMGRRLAPSACAPAK